MFAKSLLTVFVISIGYSKLVASAGGWSYDNHGGNGPDSWSRTYPNCGGSKQSPIDIKPSSAVLENMGDFTFKGYDTSAGYSYRILNNGHTAQLNVDAGEMTVTGGSLPNGPFRLAQFHVHWGSSNDVGSEHTVDGKFYPLEIHLVHFNTRYTNLTESLKYEDGLAVLGIFAQVGSTRNDALQKFVDKFDSIANADTTGDIDAFPMNGLLPAKTNEFTRYSGSLTTPACLEIVTWTVFKNPITITQTQLNAFRSLNHNAAGLNQEKLVNNYRPVQPINGRVVKRSYDARSDGNRLSMSSGTSLLFGMAITLSMMSVLG